MKVQDVRKKFASSIDVARLAGVSQSAVSRTFTPGASVSAKTRKKVIAAAEELGYQPSIIPKIMLTQRSALVAIVIGGMYNPYYNNIVDRLARGIQESGSSVLLFTVDHGEYIDEVVPLILSYRVDGMISALSIVSAEAAESCARARIPVVLFNGRLRNDWVSSVCCDNVGGGRDIAELFIARGCRRVAYIGGKKGNLANDDRLAGYMGRLAEEGITDIRIVYGDFQYEGGARAARQLLSSGDRLDAIFCANDLMGIGALEVARHEFKLRMPDQLLIAGFDDIPAASWPSIDLTTIKQDAPKMVSAALTLLGGMIVGAAGTQGSLRLIAAQLVERSSTRRVPTMVVEGTPSG
jgi:DNA-binding LacI/PurR family transcriptional regulator